MMNFTYTRARPEAGSAAAEIKHAAAVTVEDEITGRARLGAVINLAGLIVRCSQRPCPDCRSVHCLIASADVPQPYGQMICVVCDRHRGQLKKRTHAFISEIIRHFGRPTEPIELRTRIRPYRTK